MATLPNERISRKSEELRKYVRRSLIEEESFELQKAVIAKCAMTIPVQATPSIAN